LGIGTLSFAIGNKKQYIYILRSQFSVVHVTFLARGFILFSVSRAYYTDFITDPKEIGFENVDCSCGSGQGAVVGSSENENKPSDFHKNARYFLIS
jgi:hypothetical protein